MSARRRPLFWLFVAVVALALAGGGAIVLNARRLGHAREGKFRAPSGARVPARPAPPPAPATP